MQINFNFNFFFLLFIYINKYLSFSFFLVIKNYIELNFNKKKIYFLNV